MGSSTETKYYCDKCHKDLKGYGGHHVNIRTRTLEMTSLWQQLHVQIFYAHGNNNDGDKKEADLCQRCAIEILKDALERVQAGERVTKGVQDSKQLDWEN